MTPAALGWDPLRQAGRPMESMTDHQIRAWAARLENLMQEHPRRSLRGLCRALGLSDEQAELVIAEMEE